MESDRDTGRSLATPPRLAAADERASSRMEDEAHSKASSLRLGKPGPPCDGPPSEVEGSSQPNLQGLQPPGEMPDNQLLTEETFTNEQPSKSPFRSPEYGCRVVHSANFDLPPDKEGHLKVISAQHSKDFQHCDNTTAEAESMQQSMQQSLQQQALSPNTDRLQEYLPPNAQNGPRLGHHHPHLSQTFGGGRSAFSTNPIGWMTPSQKRLAIQEQRVFNAQNMTQREVDYRNKRKRLQKLTMAQMNNRNYAEYATTGYQGHVRTTSHEASGGAEESMVPPKGHEVRSAGMSRDGRRVRRGLGGPGTAPAGQRPVHRANQRLKQRWVNHFSNTQENVQLQMMPPISNPRTPGNALEQKEQPAEHQRGISIESFLLRSKGATMSSGQGTDQHNSCDLSRQNAGSAGGVRQAPIEEPGYYDAPYSAEAAESLYQNKLKALKNEASFGGDTNQQLNPADSQEQHAMNQQRLAATDGPYVEHDYGPIVLRYSIQAPAPKQSPYQNQVETTNRNIQAAALSSRSERPTRPLATGSRHPFFFSNQNKASYIGRQIDKSRVVAGKKVMRSFIQAHACLLDQGATFGNNNYEDRSLISEKNPERQCYDQQEGPITISQGRHEDDQSFNYTTSAIQHFQQKHSRMCKLIDQIKLSQNVTERMPGMSLFYQDSHHNMFQTTKQNKRQYIDGGYVDDQIPPARTGPGDLIKEERNEKVHDDLKVNGMQQSGGDPATGQKDQINAAGPPGSKEMERSMGDQDKGTHWRRSPFVKPCYRVSRGEYFKKEIKNAQHQNASNYRKENKWLQDICQKQIENKYLARNEQISKAADESIPPSALRPARVIADRKLSSLSADQSPHPAQSKVQDQEEDPEDFGLDDKELLSKLNVSDNQNSRFANKNKAAGDFQKLIDPENGLIYKLVSNSIVDLEDIMHNKQFRRSALDTKALQRMYEGIKKSKDTQPATGGIPPLSSRKAGASQYAGQPRDPPQGCRLRLLHDTLPKPSELKYHFSHEIKHNPKSKKDELLKALGVVQTGKYTDDSAINARDQTPPPQEQSKRPRKKSAQDSSHSLTSSQERQKRDEENWKPENDSLFKTDKYVFKVKTRRRGHSQDEDSSSHDKYSQKSGNLSDEDDPERVDLQTFLTNIDERIEAKRTNPDYDDQVSSVKIKYMAQDLYKLIKGVDRIPHRDREYQKYVLNVFATFSEDPLKNDKVVCGIKPIVASLKDSALDKYAESKDETRKRKKDRMCCQHTFGDDEELHKLQRIQLWFLNFCKYICVLVLNTEIGDIDVLDEENGPKNEALVAEKHNKVEEIMKTVGKQSFRKRKSKKKLATENILRNLAREADKLADGDKGLFTDSTVLERSVMARALDDPILKLVVIKRPQQVLDFTVNEPQSRDSGVLAFDENKELFLNQLAHKVLHAFKNEIIQIRRRKYVTFRNVTSVPDGLFSVEDSKALLKNLSGPSVAVDPAASQLAAGAATHSSQAYVSQREMAGTSVAIEHPLTDPRGKEHDQDVENAVQETESKQDARSKEGTHSARSTVKLAVSKSDMIRQLINIIAQRKQKDYEHSVSQMLAQSIQQLVVGLNKKKAKEKALQYRKAPGRADKPSETEGPRDPDDDAALIRDLPLSARITLYQGMKGQRNRSKVQLHKEQQVQFQFYDKAKQLMHSNDAQDAQLRHLAAAYRDTVEEEDGVVTRDMVQGEEVQYFKVCETHQLLPIPILFKYLNDNEIYMRGVSVSLGQARAIKQTLIDAADGEQHPQTCEQNPFLIKNLVIDECGMADEVFAEILEGIAAQNCLRGIHYVNYNELGQRSCKWLRKICSRALASNCIQELNLSNVQIVEAEGSARDGNGLLVQITQEIETVGKVNRIRLSNLDLNDPELTKNLLEILQSHCGISYVNVAHGNLQLADLIALARELVAGCPRLEYLSIGGNKITGGARGTTKPKVQEAMVDELVTNICELIEVPQSTLRFLDVSEMGFDLNATKRILKSLQKNSMLESVNLGQVHGDEQLATIQKMLKLESKKVSIELQLLPSGFETVGASLEELYVNAGLLQLSKRRQQQRESMLMRQDTSLVGSPTCQLVLNRTARNPELMFSSYDPDHLIDPELSQKWRIVKNCFYCNSYRYVQVYFNGQAPHLNDLRVLPNQEEVLSWLDSKYGDPDATPGPKAPLLIADGCMYQMVNPIIYAGMAQADTMKTEVETQIKRAPYGAMDLTGLNLGASTISAGMKKEQERLNKLLAAMDENAIRGTLCGCADDKVTLGDLENLSDFQLTVLQKFYSANWEFMINETVMENNRQHITVVNKQDFDFCRPLVKAIDDIKAKNKKKHMNNTMTTISTNRESAESVCHESSIESLQSRSDFFKLNPIYIFAGWLPPGRNSIYIYDRERRVLYYWPMVIDECNHILQGPQWSYRPPALEPLQPEDEDPTS